MTGLSLSHPNREAMVTTMITTQGSKNTCWKDKVWKEEDGGGQQRRGGPTAAQLLGIVTLQCHHPKRRTVVHYWCY